MNNAQIRMTGGVSRFKSLCLAFGGMALGGAAFAQTAPVTTPYTFAVNSTIPDGSPSGLSDVETVDLSSQQLFSITQLQVTLNITGGFNGDYYAYLVHDGSFVVLMNREGRTAANSAGYADSGYNITLSSTSANDLHTYQTVSNPNGGVLTGTFAPDGRNIDPSLVLDTTPQTTSLSSFIGDDPSGTYTLFIADVDAGQQGTLVSWGLDITSVPEPGISSLMILGTALFGGYCWMRRKG
jgi:subtilisin-like proprotein convertase family protein